MKTEDCLLLCVGRLKMASLKFRVKKMKEKYRNKKRMYFFKFLAHFMLVMAFLVISAVCFMEIEKPHLSTKNEAVVISGEDFLKSINSKYALNLSLEARQNLQDDFKQYFDDIVKNGSHNKDIQERQDRWHMFSKWFYFTNIAATTVGKYQFHTYTLQCLINGGVQIVGGWEKILKI